MRLLVWLLVGGASAMVVLVVISTWLLNIGDPSDSGNDSAYQNWNAIVSLTVGPVTGLAAAVATVYVASQAHKLSLATEIRERRERRDERARALVSLLTAYGDNLRSVASEAVVLRGRVFKVLDGRDTDFLMSSHFPREIAPFCTDLSDALARLSASLTDLANDERGGAILSLTRQTALSSSSSHLHNFTTAFHQLEGSAHDVDATDPQDIAAMLMLVSGDLAERVAYAHTVAQYHLAVLGKDYALVSAMLFLGSILVTASDRESRDQVVLGLPLFLGLSELVPTQTRLVEFLSDQEADGGFDLGPMNLIFSSSRLVGTSIATASLHVAADSSTWHLAVGQSPSNP